MTVAFRLDRPARVALTLTDARGRVVLTVPEQAAAAGAGEVALDASALSPGVYAVSLVLDGVAKPGSRIAVVR